MHLHDDPYSPIPYATLGDPFADTLSHLSSARASAAVLPTEPSSYAALGTNNPATDPSIPPARTFDDILARKAADDHETGVRCTTTLHPSSSSSGMCFVQDLYCRRCYSNSSRVGDEYKPCRALNCIAPVGGAGLYRRDSAHVPDEGGAAMAMSLSCPACAGPMEDDVRPERWIETCDDCRNGPGMVRRSASRAKAELSRAVSTRSRSVRQIGRMTSMRSERVGRATTNSSSNTNINVDVNAYVDAHTHARLNNASNAQAQDVAEQKKPRKSALVRKGLSKLKRVLGMDDDEEDEVPEVKECTLERKPTRSRNRAW